MTRRSTRHPKNLRVVSFTRPTPNQEPDRLTDAEWELIDRARQFDAYDGSRAALELLSTTEAELLREYRTLTKEQQFYFRLAIQMEVDRNTRNAIMRAQQVSTSVDLPSRVTGKGAQ